MSSLILQPKLWLNFLIFIPYLNVCEYRFLILEFVPVERFDYKFFGLRNEDDIVRFFLRIDTSRHNLSTVVDEDFNRGLVEENVELENLTKWSLIVTSKCIIAKSADA